MAAADTAVVFTAADSAVAAVAEATVAEDTAEVVITVTEEGGIFSNLIGAILSPFIFGIIGIILIVVFFASVGQAGSKQIKYDESKFQSYAMGKYEELYGKNEDDILVVFLASENPENDGYYQICIVGDNVKTTINYMFGNDETIFGGALDESLSDNYNNQLLPAFRTAVGETAKAIQALGYQSNFFTDPQGTRARSRFINKTEYVNVNGELMEVALNEFSDKTDIAISIYVADMDDVFDRSNYTWVLLVAGIICLLISFFLIFIAVKAVKAFRSRRSGRNYNSGNSDSGTGGRFY